MIPTVLDEKKRLEAIAYALRVDCLKATTQAGSGHVTSCLSAADIVAVLFFHVMQFDINTFKNPLNDRFILSKGHAAPLLYSVWKELGCISEDELLTLRTFNSVLEGHPTTRFEYNEAATGSLGQGLSIGLGMALTAKADKHAFKTYVLLGDSEMTEGSNWEAAELASYYKTDNLIAIIDVNNLGQTGQTIEGYQTERYRKKFEAFGWSAFVCDGHSIEDLIAVFKKADESKHQPIVIIAKTIKGYGLDSEIEGKNGFHGKAIPKEQLNFYSEKLRERFPQAAEDLSTMIPFPHRKTIDKKDEKKETIMLDVPIYRLNDSIATRYAYGQALVALGKACQNAVILDAEVKNSTYTELFEKQFPERFYQCYIAEQNMIGMAVGMVIRGKIPFSSTFASFLTRAHDQIRMAAIGNAAVRICGSHAGVSIGEDGPSQMGLEDIGMMRALSESIILYPCDAVSAYKCVELMANYTQGVSYLRTTRGATPVIYNNNETFTIGGCKQLRWSLEDKACIVTAGITVFEALKAYDILKAEGILIRVIDCYSIKPLPKDELFEAAQMAGKHIITVEDHYPAGGLGEAVCASLINSNIKITCLAVTKMPRSGTAAELFAYEEIDAAAIVCSVKGDNKF